MAFFTDCIVWISAYAALRFLFFFFAIPYDSLLAIAADIFYWAALFLHLRRGHSLLECGICIPSRPWFRSAAVLLLIPALQCFLYGFPGTSLRELLVLLFAALAEEMAFRVLLPKLLSKQMHVSAINATLFSSIIFALFHGAAHLAAASLPIVLLQMLYAFCAGCAFCAVVQRTKSVLPSLALHALINWTAGEQTAGTVLYVSTLAFSVLLISYAIIVFHKTQRGATYL